MLSPVQQDLDWLANAPSLVRAEALDTPTIQSLPSIEVTGEELARALETRNAKRLRLGVYFEDLVELQLRHTPGITRVLRGMLVREDKITLGELDFLFLRGDGQWEHWEVAVKFYLFAEGEDPNPDRCFLGPRTVDRMDRKITRMRDHQLRLPHLAAAKESIGLDAPIVSKALVRGRLHYPLDMDWRSAHLDSLSTDDHLRGWWAPLRDLSELPAAEHYLIVKKQDWLTCPTPSPNMPLHTRDSLSQSLTSKHLRPVQVIGIDANHSELHRGFVVPDDWPHSSQR